MSILRPGRRSGAARVRDQGRARSLALAVCVSAPLLLGPLAAPVGAQLAVDKLELELAPGLAERRTGTVVVSSDLPEPVVARVYLADWDRDVSGSNRFYEPGTRPGSCGARMRVFPQTLQLTPGVPQTVQIAVDSIDALQAECWSIVFVEARLPTSVAAQRGVNYRLRIGTKVYVVPPGLRSELRVDDVVHLAPADTLGRRLRIAVANSGAVHLTARGSVEIRTPLDEVAARVALPDLPMLPGARRELDAALPALAPGRYIALVMLDHAGPEIAAGQIEFEVR